MRVVNLEKATLCEAVCIPIYPNTGVLCTRNDVMIDIAVPFSEIQADPCLPKFCRSAQEVPDREVSGGFPGEF